jgi:hypothetical protein
MVADQQEAEQKKSVWIDRHRLHPTCNRCHLFRPSPPPPPPPPSLQSALSHVCHTSNDASSGDKRMLSNGSSGHRLPLFTLHMVNAFDFHGIGILKHQDDVFLHRSYLFDNINAYLENLHVFLVFLINVDFILPFPCLA